jgi:hypothetical protein
MSATIHMCGVAVSHRMRSLAVRTWPALLTLLTLACVTPFAAAMATPTEPRPTAPAPTPAPSTPPVAPSKVSPAQPQCDTDWDDGHDYVIHIDEQKDDGRQVISFNPDQPMTPYELRGARYLFREKGRIYRTVGRFQDEKEGEAMLRKVEGEMTHLYTSAYPPYLSKLGAYLASESPTCKVGQQSRSNRTIESASWVLEKEGVLLAGTQSECGNGSLTKKVTVISCDGKKNLLTDTVEEICDRTRRVYTCVYTLEPGVILLKHKYTIEGETDVDLRVYDVRKKKRLYSQQGSYGPGLDHDFTDPKTDVEDVDQDGVPEIVSTQQKTGQRLSVRKWQKGRFVETRSP